MKTIRKNTFETNSSSSHSITIDTTNKIFPKIDYNGEPFYVKGGQYGWGYKEYSLPIDKINYLAVESVGNYNLRKILTEIIKERYNCGEVIYDLEDSYIDHQSVGTVYDYTGSDKDMLESFIFGKNSILYTDNDNH